MVLAGEELKKTSSHRPGTPTYWKLSFSKKLSAATIQKIKNHIMSFPARESHFSREKNKRMKYLDSALTIAATHRLFLQANLDCQVSDWSYRTIFKNMKEIRLGSPRSDICDTYARFLKPQSKLVCPPKQHQLKQEKLHVRKGNAFFTQLRNVRKIAEEDPKIYLAFCFDYQKSSPFPLTDAGQENYLRQLWIHNLGIHNLRTKRATMVFYAELV